ncbi:DUF3253 domain-containing protein [Nocardioides cavernae]|uniref:DUF3253 domain-containing protein n=1 Tax=Nocardioides TaxID=1839 RepID=UPI000AF4F78F|nr:MULTISPECIES: DUF3253 domain-containing protein [Nocardioides]MCK9824278.1 DUF3253 domain-containing protein [Nocardioides cavernae]
MNYSDVTPARRAEAHWSRARHRPAAGGGHPGAPRQACSHGDHLPLDAAREVGDEDSWRDLMDPARAAAARLVDRGEVEITRGGEVVDLATATGPIRIRRR